jgi:type IV pilus assembly protein PilC
MNSLKDQKEKLWALWQRLWDKKSYFKPGGQENKKPYFLKLTTRERILFAKRLSILMQANVPIISALQIIKSQSPSKSAGFIIASLISEVENGQFLSSAMAQFKKVFGEFALNVVRIGEVSGTLNENLNYLSEELKKNQELKRKIVSALIYPMVIVAATLGISGLLVVYVLPKILPVFKSFKFQLPWSTRSLIFIADGLSRYGLYIFLGLVAVFTGLLFLLRRPGARRGFDSFVLRLPILGPMFQNYFLANFCRTLGLLLKSEIRIEEAALVVASTASNLAFRRELEIIAVNITKGEKLSAHMLSRPKFFPPMMAQMAGVGETAGNLSGSLLYLASIYEEELSDSAKNLSSAIEPVLMIFMGIVVGFIAVSIITPIYGITQNLHP